MPHPKGDAESPPRRSSKPAAGAGVLVLLLLAAGSAAHAAVQVPADFTDEIVVDGLDEPTSFAFLPDGRLLLTEQSTGKIRLVVHGHLAANDPVFVVPDLEAGGERGLLGIAIDPDWPVRPFVYVVYTRFGGKERLVRYLASDDVEVPDGELLSLSAPRLILDDIRDVWGNHNGGGLRFGPDRNLYLSLGEDAFPCDAADSTTLRGEILRLRVSQLPIYGGPMPPRALITPPDNPFVASPDSNARLVFAFGLRNPFRFHFDRVLGTMVVADVGESMQEEMDEVAAGDFLGWPWAEGNLPHSVSTCPDPDPRPARAPIATWDHDGLTAFAIISAGAYRPLPGASSNWPPEYYTLRGDVFFANYYSGQLRRISYGAGGWAPAAPVPGQTDPDSWGTGFFNCADFLVGPDGSLWWIAQSNQNFDATTGALHRVVYVGPPTGVGAAPAASRALHASPNPFRHSLELSFALPTAGLARVTIHDLAGRRVRMLLDGWSAAGPSRLAWDGTDDRGQPAAAGAYFARLARPGAAPVTVRVLRLR
jgi:glucose/arabinose dehydrogenase